MFDRSDGARFARQRTALARHNRCIELGITGLVRRRAFAGDVKAGCFHVDDQRFHHVDGGGAAFEHFLAAAGERQQMFLSLCVIAALARAGAAMQRKGGFRFLGHLAVPDFCLPPCYACPPSLANGGRNLYDGRN